MEFAKVKRDDLINKFKEYISLLKKCPKNMEFHTMVEFCGIDKQFLEVTAKYYAKQMKEAKEAQQKEEQDSGDNI